MIKIRALEEIKGNSKEFIEKEFENKLQNYIGCKHIIAVTSATTGLEVALRALNIGAGDEVIVPAFTWISTANAAEMYGAKPVFVDIDLDTFSIDVREIIKKIKEISNYNSKGFEFLIGKIPPDKTKGVSPYKRWNMFLRWMVRDAKPDLGLWKGVEKNRLIIPLDTHTHKVSLNLGLLKRKTYDLQAAIELTDKLKEFDSNDPLKYDFALYRIGQLKINIF